MLKYGTHSRHAYSETYIRLTIHSGLQKRVDKFKTKQLFWGNVIQEVRWCDVWSDTKHRVYYKKRTAGIHSNMMKSILNNIYIYIYIINI